MADDRTLRQRGALQGQVPGEAEGLGGWRSKCWAVTDSCIQSWDFGGL